MASYRGRQQWGQGSPYRGVMDQREHGPLRRLVRKRRSIKPYNKDLSIKCWETFTNFNQEKLKRSAVYVREIQGKMKKLSLFDLEAIHEKVTQAYEVSSKFPKNSVSNHLRYGIQRLRDLVGNWLVTKRQGHPPQRQQPLQTSGAGTSQRGGSVMGGSTSERRSGSISDPELRIQDQTFTLVPSNSDPEDNQMLKELLARIANLEQKNEANEHEIDELKRKNSELEQANETLRNDLTQRIDVLESAGGSMHAGTTPPSSMLTHEINKLKRGIETLSRQYNAISRQLECEFSESFGQVDRDEGLDSLVDDLKSTVDNLRNIHQPQCTDWQKWKVEACKLLKVNTPGDKTRETFDCYDSTCPYKDKTGITLKAYIMHLKSQKYHNHDIAGTPELCKLPVVV